MRRTLTFGPGVFTGGGISALSNYDALSAIPAYLSLPPATMAAPMAASNIAPQTKLVQDPPTTTTPTGSNPVQKFVASLPKATSHRLHRRCSPRRHLRRSRRRRRLPGITMVRTSGTSSGTQLRPHRPIVLAVTVALPSGCRTAARALTTALASSKASRKSWESAAATKAAKAARSSYLDSQVGRALFGGPPDSRLQTESQPDLRFMRLTATLPHSEKPRTLTRGAPGRPLPESSRWSKVPITP